MKDRQFKLRCRKEDNEAILRFLRCDHSLHVQTIGSNLLEVIMIVQLSDEIRTYLTLKFPNIVITEARFVNGKM